MAKKKYSKKYNNTVNIFWPGGNLDISSVKGLLQEDVKHIPIGEMQKNVNNITGYQAPKGNNWASVVSNASDLFSGIASMIEGKSTTPITEKIGLPENAYAGGGGMGIANSVIKGVQDFIGNSQLSVDPKSIKSDVTKYGQLDLGNITNYDDLLSKQSIESPLKTIRAKDLKRGNFGSDFLKSVGASGEGLMEGGTAGAIIRGVGSLAGSLFGRLKANKEKRRINEGINIANLSRSNTFMNKFDNIYGDSVYDRAALFADNGGPLNMRYTGVMSPFGYRFDLGGNMDTTFTNGVTIVGNGGTHEESPLEGVPMGIASDGKPNLVEEGEVIWNNYVFSDRLKVPKEVIHTLGLKGNNISFADAAKQIQEESKERPNDPISKNGLQANMTKLINTQETVRQEKEGNQFATGGKLGKLYEGDGEYPNYLDFGMFSGYTPLGILDRSYYLGNTPKIRGYNTSNDIPIEMPTIPLKTTSRDYNTWKFGDEFPYYSNGRYDTDYINWVNNGLTEKMVKEGLQNYPELFSRYLKSNPNYTPTLAQARKWMTDGDFSDWHKYAAMLYSKYLQDKENADIDAMLKASESLGMPFIDEITTPTKSKTPVGNESEETNGSSVNPMRIHPLTYTPVLGAGIAVLNDLLGGNKPDYGTLNEYEKAIKGISPIEPEYIGNYLQYTPLDRNYYINKALASNAGTRRLLQNISGGNRAVATAGILGTDYNTIQGLGELARQAEEYNWNRRQTVEQFNRGTNQYNADSKTRANIYNADQQLKTVQLLGSLAEARQKIKDANRLEKIANLTNLFEGLEGVGRQRTDLDMLRWLGETDVLRGESKNAYEDSLFSKLLGRISSKKNSKKKR